MIDIIDKAYVLFSGYETTRPLDVCTACCMTLEDEEKLANLPINEISQALLANYNDSAKPKKTKIDEIKHFLPRYLELISQYNFPSHSAELSFSRLMPFDKNEWSVAELDLLRQFSEAFFRQCLNVYPIPSFGDSIDNIIIMFWRANFDIDRLLEIFGSKNTKESLLHFRDLYFYGFEEYNKTKLSNTFGDNELSKILKSWIDRKDIKEKISALIEVQIIGVNDFENKDLSDLSLLYDILTA